MKSQLCLVFWCTFRDFHVKVLKEKFKGNSRTVELQAINLRMNVTRNKNYNCLSQLTVIKCPPSFPRNKVIYNQIKLVNNKNGKTVKQKIKYE